MRDPPDWRRQAEGTWHDRIMTKLQTNAFQRLNTRRDELARLLQSSSDGAGTAEPESDQLDRATNFEQSQRLEALSERERRELQDIDAALARIEIGTYGRCEACEGPIGLQRLNAIPETRFCVRCSAAAVEAR